MDNMSVQPTAPVQAPKPVQPLPPQQQAQPPMQEPVQDSGLESLSQLELMYALSAFFYATASKIAYEALKGLDQNLVTVNSLANPDIAQAEQAGIETMKKAEVESQSDQSLQDAADAADTIEMSTGASSDNTRHD